MTSDATTACTPDETATAQAVGLRAPRPEDGRRMHRLALESQGLEVNTGYAYVLLCDHFAATSVIAERGDAPVGFIAGYRPPTKQDCVFVWQVAVHPSARGLGLGSQMLDHLIARPECGDARFLEATVSPSNRASRRLFESFAKRHGASFGWSAGYLSNLFGAATHSGEAHEAEELIRVGPLPVRPQTSSTDSRATGVGRTP
jgi:L-2,4-diaminobutyric acid acetyltransferase